MEGASWVYAFLMPFGLHELIEAIFFVLVKLCQGGIHAED